MQRGKATKLKRTDDECPLTAHANGVWCMRIRGKGCFLSFWGKANAALQKYLDVQNDLQAGRISRGDTAVIDGFTSCQ